MYYPFKSNNSFSGRLLFAMIVFLCFGQLDLQAQGFRVQLAAYNEKHPDSFFKEKGVLDYTEVEDNSGIFWYSAGQFHSREEAEAIQDSMKSKGFANAFIIDEAEQEVLSGKNCHYIRDGVVFMEDPNRDPSEHTIYFDFGKSDLNRESESILDGVYLLMKQKADFRLNIQGYTDGVGEGLANMQLAASRSRSARDYLIYKGIRADRMFLEVFGEAEPAAPNAEDDGSNAGKGRDLPENRKWNRRVTLKLEEPKKAPKVGQGQ